MKLWHRHQLIITCKLCEDCKDDLVQSILTTTCAALSWKQERSRSRQLSWTQYSDQFGISRQIIPFLLSSFQIEDPIMIQIKGEEIIFIHMIAVFIMFVCLFTCFSQEGVFAFGSTFGFEAPPKHCCLKTKGTTKSKKNG